MKRLAVVALSGGVDSAVAAALLQEQGYEVVGMTLQLFDCSEEINERSCCGFSGVADARAAAGHLGIPHYVLNGRERFAARILRPAWEQYDRGRTPNPCVACNEEMKFGMLYEQARALGAERVASGHHARIVREAGSRAKLLRGQDPQKDQSYFLFSLSAEQLDRCLLPIGGMSKPEVRALAETFGLPNATRAESQDACIAQRGDFAETLRQRFGGQARPGTFVDRHGVVLGEHAGVHHFTVGQRKGLGIALGSRAYVVAIDAKTNSVTLGTDKGELAAAGLTTRETRWHRDLAPGEIVTGQVQIRYRHQAIEATIHPLAAGGAKVFFQDPELSVSPGQAAVFYDGDEVIGGGWIHEALPCQSS